MFRILHIVPLLLLLLVNAAAQTLPDPYVWVFDSLHPGFGQSSLDLYDASGNLYASAPLGGSGVLPVTTGRVAKSLDARVWVANSNANRLEAWTSQSGLTQSFSVPGIESVVVDAAGFPWTYASAGVFGGGTLERRHPNGAILETIPVSTLLPRGMASDPFGGIWILDYLSVRRVLPGGVVHGPFSLPAASLGLSVDPQGRAWVLHSGGLVLLDVNGAAVASIPLPSAYDLALDPLGRPRVLVDPGAGFELLTIDPASSSVIAALPLPVGSYAALEFDARGQIWLHDSLGVMTLLDANGRLLNRWNSPGPPEFGISDPTGLHMAAILHPTLDSDGDGFRNDEEIRSGSDCFLASDIPGSLVLRGPALAGNPVILDIQAPKHAGRVYVLTAAFTGGSIPLSGIAPYELPLALDPLLTFWLTGPGALAPGGILGFLDGQGQASTSLLLPPGTASLGFSLATAFIDPWTQVFLGASRELPVVIR